MNNGKQKHTPGPWKAEKLGYDGFRITYNHEDGVKRYLCHGHEEKNASLIAAAPELLAELNRCKNHLAFVLDGIARGQGGEIPIDGAAVTGGREAIASAKATIAKALGRDALAKANGGG